MHLRVATLPLVVCTLGLAYPCGGQGVASRAELLAQLKSSSVNERATAFEALQKGGAWKEPMMAPVLLRLLESEHAAIAAFLRRSSDGIGEGWGEYSAALLDVCLEQCPSQGVLDLLLRDADDGSVVRFDALGLLGVVALRFSPQQRLRIDSALVSATLASTNWFERSAALSAIGRLVRSDSTLPQIWRQRMHAAAISASTAPNTTVRISGVMLLGEFADAADLPRLRLISQTDSARTVNRGVESFPVRSAALKAIAMIPAR